MKDLITNESITSLIDDLHECEDPFELAYTRIFPYEYVPESIDDGWTYICFDMDVHVSDKTFLTPIIYVWVFSHKSRLRVPTGGIRPDKLSSEVCKVINGSRFYGLGELSLHSVKRFAPMPEYLGKCLTFYAKDFNRQYNGSKATPKNRKNI